MTALIAASAVSTCLGDGEQTFAALLRGESGVAPLAHFAAARTNVAAGYPIAEDGPEQLFRPSRWLTACVRRALAESRVDPTRQRVAAVVGTGLGELRAAERSAVEGLPVAAERLHFQAAVRAACPQVARVLTVSNACSAGGHALALAEDLLALDEADAVIAAATDGMTESMLAMIGRFAEEPTERVRPFDRDRTGALLGEGAAALVIVPEGAVEHPRARLLGSGLSCDAAHETVPSADGIWRAIESALERAGRTPPEVDMVVAHGTGTALNDPTEALLLLREFADRPERPLVTALKGALGHTSGSAALMNVDVAIRCLAAQVVPPIVGLERRIDEAERLRLITGAPVEAPLRLAQINAFGFGGVNAVTLVERA